LVTAIFERSSNIEEGRDTESRSSNILFWRGTSGIFHNSSPSKQGHKRTWAKAVACHDHAEASYTDGLDETEMFYPQQTKDRSAYELGADLKKFRYLSSPTNTTPVSI